MPPFREIWLSGGEPTLREELPTILALFYRRNGVRSVNFPANGLLPDKLVRAVESTLDACPDLRINLNMALDGIGPTHDAIRGVPGNFDRALESLERLQALRRREPRLRLHVNSVVCRANLEEMVPLGEMIRDRFDLDGHYFQIIRGEPMDPGLLEVHKESLERLYRELGPLYRHYADKIGRRKGWPGRAGYLGVIEALPRDPGRQPGSAPPLAHALHRRPEHRGAGRERRHPRLRASASGSGTSATTTATGGGSGPPASERTRSTGSGARAAGAPTCASSTRASRPAPRPR